jgi:IS1 family transposase
MALHAFLFLLVVCLILSLTLLWRLDWFHPRPSHSSGRAMHSIAQRLLKPRTPDDCPACRLASTPLSAGGTAPAPVRPWSEVKSRRGAPKRVNTEGFACPSRKCLYFGITEARIHALVGDGKHGHAERIQTFRCQACRTTWLTRAGQHVRTLHERFCCHLRLPHLQLDELRTRLRSATQVLWLWLAIDPCTKILPVLQLGPRTQTMAHRLIHSLRQILAPGYLPLFTSDGLNLYFYALTAHFGQWLQVGRRGRKGRRWQVASGLIYGQVKKSSRCRKLVRVSQVMRLGTETALKVTLQGLGYSGRLNTAFIERLNLTVRHGVAALARRTWATAQQSPHLLAHLEWWRAYYHFVRPHESLRVALNQPRERGGNRLVQRYRPRTPAMAAGRTTRRWTAREVLLCPLLPISA